MRWLRDLLREQAAAGRTVLVSSHLLSEVAQTADELIVIRDGKLVAKTSLDEFTTGSTSQMRVRASNSRTLAAALRGRGGTVETEEGGPALLVSGLDGEAIGALALCRRDRDPRTGAAALQPRGPLPRGDRRGGAPG